MTDTGRDMIPDDWQDDSLYVNSLDEVVIPPEPDMDMEGVTDGTVPTDEVEIEDTTESEVTYEGVETYETYETEPAFIDGFDPVETYHYDDYGNFIVDEI